MNKINENNEWIIRGSKFLLTYVGEKESNENIKKNLINIMIKNKAIAAMWNYDYDYSNNGKWYRCIIDNPNYNINNIISNNVRHNLRRSMKRCEIRKVTYEWIANNCYNIYIKATDLYNNYKKLKKSKYKKYYINEGKKNNCIAYAAFVGEIPIAYMTIIINNSYAFANQCYFDPGFSNCYPMYALYYNIPKELFKEGIKVFDRGTKPLVHETNIDEFLVRLGYRISYCKLGLYLPKIVRYAIYIYKRTLPLTRDFIPIDIQKSISGLLLAIEISKYYQGK